MSDYQNKIDEIKDKVDIVDIISEHVHLEKKGNNYVGLCPFHDDKNPSLTVSPTKKIYTCFSCHASGNAITFIEKFKRISFSEALRELGNRVGVTVSQTKEEKFYLQNKRYYDIIEESAKFYHFYLTNTNNGLDAIKYLHNRNITDDIIKRFNIGLASNESDLLYRMLSDKNHLVVDMIDAGVVRSGSSFYDVFKSRIMFPISDLNGKLVGFSGRKYQESNESKYVNSAENVIFKKGNILYNYYEAFQDIKQNNNVFVFEGFMDVIAAHRANVKNSVATMGTAFTIEQIKAIRRITENITLCYDGDIAGIESTKRAIKLLNQFQMNVSCIIIPDGLDPDEYVNKFGNDALKDLLVNNQVNAIDYIYENEKKSLIKNDINSVEKFKKEIFNFLHMFNSNVLIESTIKKLSHDLEISVSGLLNDYDENKYKPSNDIYIPIIVNKNTGDIVNIRDNAKVASLDILQKKLINIAIKHPERCAEIESKFDNFYVSPDNRDIMLHVHQYFNVHNVIDEEVIKAKLPDETATTFEKILNMEFPSDVSQVEVLLNGFGEYKKHKILMEIRQEPNSVDKLNKTISARRGSTKFLKKGGDFND